MTGKRTRTDGTTETATNRCDWCGKRKAVRTAKFPGIPVRLNVCGPCAKEGS